MSFTTQQLAEIERIVDARIQRVTAPTPYELRAAAGFPFVEVLAKKANVRSGTILKYERGELLFQQVKTYENFTAIAEALGIPVIDYSGAVMRQVEKYRASLRATG